MAGYPDNLPAYVPPPAAPASAAMVPAKPKSTYDTLKDRGSDLMKKVNDMSGPTGKPFKD